MFEKWTEKKLSLYVESRAFKTRILMIVTLI